MLLPSLANLLTGRTQEQGEAGKEKEKKSERGIKNIPDIQNILPKPNSKLNLTTQVIERGKTITILSEIE